MQIRREDKEFINYLRLLGAGMGAILAVLAVFHLRDNAKNQLSEQRHYVQQNFALANSPLIKSLQVADNIATGFLDNAKQADAELGRLESGFWATVSQVDLIVLSATVCVAGLVGGYCSVWLLSAIGTLGTIKLIRLTYKIIWHIRPEFDGGRQQIQSGNNVRIKRNEHRILPGLLKLSVMALIGLLILWAAVYYYTG